MTDDTPGNGGRRATDGLRGDAIGSHVALSAEVFDTIRGRAEAERPSAGTPSVAE